MSRPSPPGLPKSRPAFFCPVFHSITPGWSKRIAHNLMHFLRLRMAPDAQAEIRAYAQAVYDHFFKPALPWTAEAFGKYVVDGA